MNLASKMNQVATYWVKQPGTDSYGKPAFSAPIQIKVRWEDTMTQIQDKTGADRVSKSTVYCASDFDLAGYLFLGNSGASSPIGVVGAYEIMQVSRVPDLRNLQTLFTAYL